MAAVADHRLADQDCLQVDCTAMLTFWAAASLSAVKAVFLAFSSAMSCMSRHTVSDKLSDCVGHESGGETLASMMQLRQN